MNSESTPSSFWSRISLDWWAVIVAFALILLVLSGLLGLIPW